MNDYADHTILDLFLKAASEHKDHPAFHYFDQRWQEMSYGDLLRLVRGIASHLIKSGIEPGSRIAILSENRPEWSATFLAILMAGCAAVPIEAQLGAHEIRNLLGDSEAALLFCSEKTRAKVEGFVGIINFDSASFKEICGIPEVDTYPPVSAPDLASLVYTSGTTSAPKGVMLTHGNFCADSLALIGFGIVHQQDNLLAALPLHHTYPFTCSFLLPIFMGAAITFPPSLKRSEFLSTIKVRRVSIFMGVPQLLELLRNGMMRRLKERPRFISLLLLGLLAICRTLRRGTGLNAGKLIFRSAHRAFGDRFRLFTSGGARLDPVVMEDLEGIGFTVLEGYGLTETSPVVTFNPIEKRKPGSAGQPLPSVELKIVDPSDAREGEIAVKGPMVMKGYYKNPEATAEVMQDGWFLTGDLGYLDEENYLFITGRKKELIVLSSGKKVYPEEVEVEYERIPLIKEIGVLEAEQERQATGLYGIVVPNLEYAREMKVGNMQDGLRREVHRVSAGLPPYKRLKGFGISAESLPRTPLGKLKRYLLKDLARKISEGPKQEGKDRGLIEGETGERVGECITALLGRARVIYSSDNLELDLGLDSLQRVELIAALENAFSLKLPESFESEVQTVQDLVSRIEEMGALPATRPYAARWEELFTGEPSEEEKRRIGFFQGKAEWFLTRFLLRLLRGLFEILFSLKVQGVERLPHPPFIIAPNHCSNLDGFVLAAALPTEVFRILYFQGYQVYFRPWPLSRFGQMVHVIPIDPETQWLRAFQLSSFVLRMKRVLCVFPEGERSWDGNLTEFKKGIGTLAREHRVPVVPVWIDGTFQILPRGAKWPRLGRIRVVLGKPLRVDEVDLSQKPQEMDEDQFFVDQVRERVRELQERK